MTTDYKDIIKKYPEFLNRKRQRIIPRSKIKEEYIDIYSCLNNEFYSIDKIAEKTGKDVREVIGKITLMEIEGLLEFEIGKGYKKKEV